MEDYHHPQNWVAPYLRSSGTYANAQQFAPVLRDLFDAKIDACRLLHESHNSFKTPSQVFHIRRL